MSKPTRSRWPLPLELAVTFLCFSSKIAAQLTSPFIQDGLVNAAQNSCSAAQDGYTYSTFPWTHYPICIDTKSEKFCTYTNADYNGGRGISFVVSPHVAASFILETFDRALGGLDGQFGEELGMWHVQDTQEKGRGVFARKDIAGIFAGESIMLKVPVLFVAKELLETATEAQKELLLDRAIENLAVKTSKIVRTLARTWGGPQAIDVVRTNSLEIKWPWVDEVPALLAVTPEIAVCESMLTWHTCPKSDIVRWRTTPVDRTLFGASMMTRWLSKLLPPSK